MNLHFLDWSIVIGYLVLSLLVGVYYSRRASTSTDEYFAAGRGLSWWLAGTSMVATTFAADTPLVVSGFIRSEGIYGNWLWWNVLMGGMLCVVFYARLWRRAGILTDMEFIELRYEGKSASVLRAFMAVYSGVLANCITIGWVVLAMVKICGALFDFTAFTQWMNVTTGIEADWGKLSLVSGLVVLTVIYTVLSGLWGVIMTDFVQFFFAMGGSIALAAMVLIKMGGPSEMVQQIAAAPGVQPKVFHMIPDFATATKLALITFMVQISIQWWGGGQGGGYIAQRLFSTRSEKDSVLAMLWFNFAHYALRPWPWIIVGLASLVYFPLSPGEDPEAAYPKMMVHLLPVGLRGLMVASLFAAFMSTITTQLNWGASYLVNDLYRRFLRKDADERHYVQVARIASLLLMVLGAIATWQMDVISQAWIYLTLLTAGAGFVGLLRWFWWRVNPWSEISALVGSFLITNGMAWVKVAYKFGLISDQSYASCEWFYGGDLWAVRLFVIIVFCTALWLVVTFLTKPVSDAHLEAFYRRVRPGGWWGHIAAKCSDVPRDHSVGHAWMAWFAGVVCIYSSLFGIGYLCLARYGMAVPFIVAAVVSGWYMVSKAPSIVKE